MKAARRRLRVESLEDRRLLAANGPVVLAIDRVDATPNATQNVQFRVAFDELVTGVDASDFGFFASGNLTTPSVTGVATDGSSDVYIVTVDTGTGDGTLRLDVIDDDSITEEGKPNKKLGGNGIGNGDFTTGETYTIDRTPP